VSTVWLGALSLGRRSFGGILVATSVTAGLAIFKTSRAAPVRFTLLDGNQLMFLNNLLHKYLSFGHVVETLAIALERKTRAEVSGLWKAQI
jgi:hypothetical protein